MAVTDIDWGTVTLTNGSTTVTGSGTSWIADDIRDGDTFVFVDGGDGFQQPIVASVQSNTELTLRNEWEGPTLTATAYTLRYQWDSSRVSAMSRRLIMLLENGTLEALAALDGSGGNKGVAFGSTGQPETYPLTPFARTVLDDADAATARTTLGAQAALGYTPVRAETPAGDATNTIRLWWGSGEIQTAVDASILGRMYTAGSLQAFINTFLQSAGADAALAALGITHGTGWIRFPWGLMIQWANVIITTSSEIAAPVFPTSFSAPPLSIQITNYNTLATPSDTVYGVHGEPGLSSFVLRSAGYSGINHVSFIAIGLG